MVKAVFIIVGAFSGAVGIAFAMVMFLVASLSAYADNDWVRPWPGQVQELALEDHLNGMGAGTEIFTRHYLISATAPDPVELLEAHFRNRGFTEALQDVPEVPTQFRLYGPNGDVDLYWWDEFVRLVAGTDGLPGITRNYPSLYEQARARAPERLLLVRVTPNYRSEE